tara:strand:+ start:318 stop:515 length:198 start_codon:yes stop_codon:yes gene_type:complete
MGTTIQVSQNTRQMLERLKIEENAPNYDQVIQGLINKKKKIPPSMFGSIKDIKWTKKDRMHFDEL